MLQPPVDPRDISQKQHRTWGNVALIYALIAVIPFLLFAASNPLIGLLTIIGGVSFLVIGGHSYRLIRCFYRCSQMTLDLFGRAQITIKRTSTN